MPSAGGGREVGRGHVLVAVTEFDGPREPLPCGPRDGEIEPIARRRLEDQAGVLGRQAEAEAGEKSFARIARPFICR